LPVCDGVQAGSSIINASSNIKRTITLMCETEGIFI
jgi:hypothetical protein